MDGYQRYAVYWCPEAGSALAAAGAGWLGWDLYQRAACEASVDPALTNRARRYGFHGTLKAPFRLAEGVTAADLDAALGALAAGLAAFETPPLVLDDAPGFPCLHLSAPCPELDALAAACVTELDRFRAPLTEEERARRLASGLSAEDTARLDRWGYPHVLEAFRFHLTLARPLEPGEADTVLPAARAHFAAHVGQPLRIGTLSLAGDPGAGFHHLATHALTG
ncbi:MAG: DUF1045 domain-containing protein [Pseudomonadota bacterium]